MDLQGCAASSGGCREPRAEGTGVSGEDQEYWMQFGVLEFWSIDVLV